MISVTEITAVKETEENYLIYFLSLTTFINLNLYSLSLHLFTASSMVKPLRALNGTTVTLNPMQIVTIQANIQIP
jgi:hypothetical protein